MAKTLFQRTRRTLAGFAAVAALLAPVLGVGGVATTYAAVDQQAQAGCNTDATFFGLVPWYKYLQLESYQPDPSSPPVCRITSFDDQSKIASKASPILLILLAILEDLIRVAGLVAVGFVIYGGIQYMTSQGSPDSTKKAQQTVINALIGLVIALLAVGIVSFIGTQLGGS